MHIFSVKINILEDHDEQAKGHNRNTHSQMQVEVLPPALLSPLLHLVRLSQLLPQELLSDHDLGTLVRHLLLSC